MNSLIATWAGLVGRFCISEFIYPHMLMLLPNHLHLTRKAIKVSFEFSQYASAAAAHHSAKKKPPGI